MSDMKAVAYDPASARHEIEDLAESARKQYEDHRQAISSGQRLHTNSPDTKNCWQPVNELVVVA